MEEVIIVGAGGFGREVALIVERAKKYKLIGFVDDNNETFLQDYKLLGNLDYLLTITEKVSVVIAIGSPTIRAKIYKKIASKSNFSYPNIVDPSAILGNNINMGIGNIICANCVLTVDIDMGDFNLINLNSTIGHDVQMKSFNSIFPSTNLSGYVCLDGLVEIGTGSQLIPNVKVGLKSTLGAGSVATKDIPENVVAVGVPAKVIKKKGEN